MSYKGNNKNKAVVKDSNGNTFQVSTDDPRYLSGELISINKGKTMAKDSNGNTFQVSTDDPRYLSGELIQFSKNKVVVKDSNGNTFQVSKDDPRYLSGEYVGINSNTWNWRKILKINEEVQNVKFFANKYNISCKELQSYLEKHNITYSIK
jgi:uncharacterized Zn ribbon protein